MLAKRLPFALVKVATRSFVWLTSMNFHSAPTTQA